MKPLRLPVALTPGRLAQGPGPPDRIYAAAGVLPR